MEPWLLINQLIGVEPTKHTIPETDLRITCSWVLLESKYTVVLRGHSRGYRIPSSMYSDVLGYFYSQSMVLSPLPMIPLMYSGE